MPPGSRKFDNSRFFSDFYDSTIQRLYVGPARDDAVRTRLIGRMRLDLLLSRKIVITDAQLLDGGFFLDQNPATLFACLKRSDTETELAIEIRSRTPNLAHSLLQFLRRGNDEHLRGFCFSSIENEAERNMAKVELEKTSSSLLSSWEDIAKLLKNIEVNKSNVERMKNGWAHWIEAQDKGLITVRQWEGGFPINCFLNKTTNFQNIIQTVAGKSILNNIIGLGDNRNSIDVILSEMKNNFLDDKKVLDDIFIIEAWFNRAYNYALASQHCCSNVESIREVFTFGDGSLQNRHTLAGEVPVELVSTFEVDSQDIFYKLGIIPNHRFLELFSDKSLDFCKWWKQGDIESLKRGFEPFAEYIVGIDTHSGNSQDVAMTIGTGAVSCAVSASPAGPLAALLGFIIGGTTVPLVLWVYKRVTPTGKGHAAAKKIVQRVTSIAESRSRGNI